MINHVSNLKAQKISCVSNINNLPFYKDGDILLNNFKYCIDYD